MVTKVKTKPITDEIATVEKDITRYYLGPMMVNPDKVLQTESGGKGIEIYEDMIYETRIFSELQKRKLAVIGKEWEILPASDSPVDQEIADFVQKCFEMFSYDRARQTLLSGIVTGFKPGEIMWDYSEGDIWIKEIKGRSPRRFTFDLKGNLRLLTWADMIVGEELPDRKFLVFRNPSDNDSPYGQGLGRPLYWAQWFKKNGVKFWAVFLEKFGQPTPWGKYPPGTEKSKQDDLLDALKAMQTDQAIITPDTMTVELLEAARTSSVDSYARWEDYWDDAMTFIILGQTATTQGTPGKLGSEELRSEVADWIIKADADLLCEVQNQYLIKWLVDYNFPAVELYPNVWIRTEAEKDLKPLAERDRIIIKEIGLPTPESYLRETYGIPEPGPDDVVLTPPTTPSPFGVGPSPGFSERVPGSGLRVSGSNSKFITHNSKLFFVERDWVAEYMRRLEPSLKRIKADAIARIEGWLRTQASPPSEEEFVSTLQGIVGSAYTMIDKTAIADAVTSAYQFFKLSDILTPGITIGFGGADVRAVTFLGRLDHFYLSKFIDNSDAQAALQQFLKERYLDGGTGLFGAGDPAVIREMKNLLSQKMIDLEGYQINRIADTGVVRIRNWAHISQLNDAGIAEIEILEPTMECPFCAQMNGKIIQVDTGYKAMMDQANMTDTEYQEFLQRNPPELDNIQDFVDQGLLPPYHPHCRGTIIKRMGR